MKMSLISVFSSQSEQQDMDPIVRLMMDRNVIALSSTLIAKLEYIRYDETRRGVFKTKWARDMFHVAVVRLVPGKLDGFDVDGWYADIVAKYAPEWEGKFEVNPSKLSQTIDTNWLLFLLNMEKDVPGFMLLLHNCLDLEDSTHHKMAEKSKKEDEYDFLGVGPRNKATQLLLGHQEARRARIKGK